MIVQVSKEIAPPFIPLLPSNTTCEKGLNDPVLSQRCRAVPLLFQNRVGPLKMTLSLIAKNTPATLI